jgi:hypothetical protein
MHSITRRAEGTKTSYVLNSTPIYPPKLAKTGLIKSHIVDALIAAFDKSPTTAKVSGTLVLRLWPGFREA